MQAGTEPLGGIRSHLIFGCCTPEGEMRWEGSLGPGAKGLARLECAFLSQYPVLKLLHH